ncbi:MAG: ABC transporter ATP-binding protein [Verrucomicrobia bacterium]|nr:MAG: ABC transporter ATP-binding protein [Verrucomicrobiota bacterium]
MNGTPKAVIEIDGLTKEFDIGLRGVRLRAVDHLGLSIPRGGIFGLLGPNGSGKSTTIKIILGLMQPTSGTCRVLGGSAADPDVRRRIGYLPESPDFYRFLTGWELVEFYGRMSGLSGAVLGESVERVLDRVGLVEASRRKIGTYSKGMLQRAGLAQALVHDPDLIILDEPTAGVDPIGAQMIAEIILALKASGKSVLLSSHLLAQVEGVCDRVAILDRGKVVLEGSVEELLSEKNRRMAVFEGLPVEKESALLAWLEANGAAGASIDNPRTTLDQIFIDRVGKGTAGESGDKIQEVRP